MEIMTRFNATTIQVTMTSIQNMLTREFFRDDDIIANPAAGSVFGMKEAHDHELSVYGYVDSAAAHLFGTESKYFTFKKMENGKMAFVRIVLHTEEAGQLEDELFNLFWNQRAHNVAWAIYPKA
jgi:hypothetical protein